MLIVPSSDQLVVEVQIRPSDIDQLSVGQATRVRFSAFDWATDELQGALVRIAADPSRDPQSKLTYYSAAVRVPERELARLNGRRLLPGMPAEVFITTGQRTIASYLLKPLLDQMKRPLRERWRFSQHPPTGERAAVAPALFGSSVPSRMSCNAALRR